MNIKTKPSCFRRTSIKNKALHVLLASVCKEEKTSLLAESFPAFHFPEAGAESSWGPPRSAWPLPWASGPRGPFSPSSCCHCSHTGLHLFPRPPKLARQGPVSPPLQESSVHLECSVAWSLLAPESPSRWGPQPLKITLLSTRPYFVLIFPPGLSSPGIAYNSLPFCVYCQFPRECLSSRRAWIFCSFVSVLFPAPCLKLFLVFTKWSIHLYERMETDSSASPICTAIPPWDASGSLRV